MADPDHLAPSRLMAGRWLLALGLAFVAAASAHDGEHAASRPPWQEASPWPDRIVVTFAADPARSIAVSWRTDTSVAEAQAQIVKATPAARFDVGAESVASRTEVLDLRQVSDLGQVLDLPANAGLPVVHFHSALFTGLQPDTLYAYRVGSAGGHWSEWFQVRTAPESGPISFIYLGDAQNGILSHWARTVRAAYAKAPEARFILHAGDLVNQGSRDFEWAQWFKAVGFVHGMMPAMPVAGNHEYPELQFTPESRRRVLSILWRPQFRLPEEPGLPDHLLETVYKVRYSEDLEVFVLDTNLPDMELQAAWLDRQLSASTARWRVASFHHPVFSSGKNRDNPRQWWALLPVLKKHDVDLVLQGHDHTYARGSMPQVPRRVSARRGERVGPMFVNSVSGAKQYEFSETDWTPYEPEGVRLDRQAENTQFFQVVRIDGQRLDYEAYTADGQLYDRFTLQKDPKDGKRLLPGVAASSMETRRFRNSAEYPGTEGLNEP